MVESNISTHAPAGGATGCTNSGHSSNEFLLTPLREGRLLPTSANTAAEVFLLTPLREGRLKTSFCTTSILRFLLTPLREGRLHRVIVFLYNAVISTHAPAGGATGTPIDNVRVQFVISTHAPAGGATKVDHAFVPKLELFLLTPLREGRRGAHRYRRRAKKHFYSRPCGRGDTTHIV